MVYFPIEGLISVRSADSTRSLESALVGPEGMVGPDLAHARASSLPVANVHIGGRALAIPADTFRYFLRQSPALQEMLHGYGLMCLEQGGHAIFAASRCTVEQRLAAWLLMAMDRLVGDDLAITHDALASALGVRRPGVTVALHMLEGDHAVLASRGRIKLRSVDRLKISAGEAYRDVFYPPPGRAEAADRSSTTMSAGLMSGAGAHP